jgi:hypothetical protein
MVQQQAQMAAQQAQQAMDEYAAQPLAIRWQTNEAIEQDVLDREILLQDDLDPRIIQAASARWMALAAQAQLKQGIILPPPGAGAPPSAPGEPTGPDQPNAGAPSESSPPTVSPGGPPAPSQAGVPDMSALGGGGPPMIGAQ